MNRKLIPWLGLTVLALLAIVRPAAAGDRAVNLADTLDNGMLFSVS